MWFEYVELSLQNHEFFFSGRAWWWSWATIFFLFAMEVGSLYNYQTAGRISSLLLAIAGAVFFSVLALGVARRSHPVLVISGNRLEYVNLIALWSRPKKLSIDGVTATSDIKGTLQLRYESGAFERVPLNLIEAKSRPAVIEAIERRFPTAA